jgi:hypothetical protein
VTSLDLTESIAPRSDQLNAEDMLTGPRTFTISEVRKGSSPEQPFDFHLAEFPGRPFKPSKTVRRILVHAWGADAAAYAGRRLTLFRDPEVRFGGQSVGGIRVSHLSHIDKQFTIALTETRGKRATHVVQPLADEPAPKSEAADAGQLRAINDGLVRLGITDGETKLATVGQVIDREVASAKELTPAEAVAVLDWIKHEEQADTEPTLPEGGAA